MPKTNEYFYKQKSTICGLRASCKKCSDIESNKYNFKNKDKVKEKKKIYDEKNKNKRRELDKKRYYENKEKISEKSKKYYLENREERLKYKKQYTKENKEKLKEANHIYYERNKKIIAEKAKEYHLKNPQKLYEKIKKYQQNNPDKCRIKRQKRQAIKKDIEATLTLNDWNYIKCYFNNSCAYCGKKRKLEQDHFIPLSKGGKYSRDNIIPACKRCNCSKSNKDFKEWYILYEKYSLERETLIYKYLDDEKNC